MERHRNVRRPKQTKAKHILHPVLRRLLWPVQGLAMALFWSGCATMSPERAARIGARFGRSLGPWSHRHQRLQDNLAVALPKVTGQQVDGIAREVWASFGATLAEYAHFETIADCAFDRHVEVVVHPGF